MSIWMKGVIGALMLAGSTLVASEPAQARVSVGIGIGVPGPYYGPGYYGPGYAPGYSPFCDRYSRWFDPYRCDADYYDDDEYWDGPIFIDGFWWNGPFRSRFHRGHREFFFHNHWREGHGGHGHFGHEGHHHH